MHNKPAIAEAAPTDNRFWMLISPALPVGGYSYSHGLESAVAAGLVHNTPSAQDWIGSLGERVLPNLELPLLQRLLQAVNGLDERAANSWNDMVLATRETAELRLEEASKGLALTQLFPALGIRPQISIDNPGFSAAYALACGSWKVPEHKALSGFAWVWFEMLVAAAIKLVPLGHTDGQALLIEFNSALDDLVAKAMDCSDEDIGAGATGLAMLSSMHETQHARQFRS